MELKQVDASSNERIIDVDILLEPDGVRVKDHIYISTKSFRMFITNQDLTERDVSEEKIRRSQNNINY